MRRPAASPVERPRRWTRGAALAAVIVLCGIALAPASYGRLPDWAKEIAQAAPPLPEGVSHDPYRVLLTERSTLVWDDGTLVVHRRVALQALRTDAKIGTGSFRFGGNGKVRYQAAWHLPPGEKIQTTESGYDVTVQDGFLTDQKRRYISVRNIEKGSLVFYEFESVVTPRVLAWTEEIYEGAPIRLARIVVETPKDWTVRTEWVRGAPAADHAGTSPPQSDKKTVKYAWEARDIPFTDAEALGDDPVDTTPRFVVTLAPPAGKPVKSAAAADWTALSTWFESQTKERCATTPPVEAQAKKILEGAGDGFFEKVRAASLFVRDKIRFTDVDAGSGQYTAHPPAETLTSLYGDSLDKAILLDALLGAAGIESWPALVNTEEPGTVSDTLPSLDEFSRFVAAVRVPAGAEIPSRASKALARAGDLGDVLIVDPSHESLSPGDLVDYLAGRTVLVLAGARGRLAPVQEGDASSHLIEHKIQVTIVPDKTVGFAGTLRFCGQPATNIRRIYNASPSERRKGLEARVIRLWPEATIRSYEADPSPLDGCITEKLAWDVPISPEEGQVPVPLFPFGNELVEHVPLGRRQTAVKYVVPLTWRSETTVTGGNIASLGAPVDARGEGWSVTRQASTTSVPTVVFTMTRSRNRFEPESFAELKKYWAAVDAAAASSFTLH